MSVEQSIMDYLNAKPMPPAITAAIDKMVEHFEKLPSFRDAIKQMNTVNAKTAGHIPAGRPVYRAKQSVNDNSPTYQVYGDKTASGITIEPGDEVLTVEDFIHPFSGYMKTDYHVIRLTAHADHPNFPDSRRPMEEVETVILSDRTKIHTFDKRSEANDFIDAVIQIATLDGKRPPRFIENATQSFYRTKYGALLDALR